MPPVGKTRMQIIKPHGIEGVAPTYGSERSLMGTVQVGEFNRHAKSIIWMSAMRRWSKRSWRCCWSWRGRARWSGTVIAGKWLKERQEGRQEPEFPVDQCRPSGCINGDAFEVLGVDAA